MQLPITIQAAEPTEEQDYSVIPNNTKLTMICEKAELKPCNGGNMVKIMYRVQDENHNNRTVFDQLVIQHTNPKAEEIGQQKLAKLAAAVGHDGPITDTDQLLTMQPFRGVVGVQKSEQYGDSNFIKAWYPLNQQQPASQQTTPAPAQKPAPTQQPAATNNNGKPAWMIS